MSLRDRVDAQRKAIADSKFTRAYKFKVGKTMIRILPGVVGGLNTVDDFYKPYGSHYIKDPRDNKTIIAVVGDAETCYSRVCPVRQAITEYIQQQTAAGDEIGAKQAREWLAKQYFVTNVEILGGVDVENKDKVVQIEFSSTQFDSVLSAIDTMFMTNPDFTLKDGLTLVVERVGTGQQDTKYTYQSVAGAVPALKQSTLDGRVDLQSYVDGKFGMSVTKALTALSTLLGKDVTNSALGVAMQANVVQPSIAAPVTQLTDALAGDTLPDALLADPIDAEFEALAALPAETPAAAPKAATAPADEFADILAELEGI